MSSIGFYDQNAEDFFQRSIDADMAQGHADFLAVVRAGGRILDAGCGSGRDSLVFLDLGFQVTAMEASEALAALARARTGLPVEVLTFDQVSWLEAFDGVWACASLLHVPRSDLPVAIGRLCDALIPGGILWMSFKHGAVEREVGGRLFTDLNERTGRELLEELEGLELISVRVTDDPRVDRPGERWLSLLCRKML